MKRHICRKITVLSSVVLLAAAILPCGKFRASADETTPEQIVVTLDGGEVSVSAMSDGRVRVSQNTGGDHPGLSPELTSAPNEKTTEMDRESARLGGKTMLVI